MRRTTLVVLTVLVAGCGGPGDVPEDDDEMPGNEAEEGGEGPTDEEENETGSIGLLGLTLSGSG